MRHPGDSRGLGAGASGGIGRPPTHAPIERVRDVLLVPTFQSGTLEEYRSNPPAGDPPFDLDHGVRICRLPGDERDLVFASCSPRGHYFVPVRQFGQRFAYERELDPAAWERRRSHWDSSEVLHTVLALSRLVRDNAHGTEFGACVVDHADGEQQVIPADASDAQRAYRLGTDRDWLDDTDAASLRDLLTAYYANEDGRPDRVGRALYVAEAVSRTGVLETALPLLVTGLETVTNTSRQQVRRQFSERVPQIAADVGVQGVTEQLCRELYDARSQASHGAPIQLLSPLEGEDDASPAGPSAEALAKVERLQAVLRATIRKAIEHPEFAATFESEESIRARWPVVIAL